MRDAYRSLFECRAELHVAGGQCADGALLAAHRDHQEHAEKDDDGAEEGHARQIRVALRQVLGEHLVLRGADDHDQRITGDRAKAHEAGHALDGAAADERAHRFAGQLDEEARPGDVLAETRGAPRLAHARNSVKANQAHQSTLSKVGLLIEPGEIVRIDRHRHHAAETAVGLVDAAREINRPFAADAAHHRLADIELPAVTQNMCRVVLARAEISRPQLVSAGHHVAALVEHADRGRELAVDHAVGEISPEVDPGPATLKILLEKQRGRVDAFQRAYGVFLEREREVGVLTDRVVYRLLPFALRIRDHAAQHAADDGQAENRNAGVHAQARPQAPPWRRAGSSHPRVGIA